MSVSRKVTMHVEGMERIYITAKLDADRRLCRVRDEIYERTGAEWYYKKVSPHITVIPPFYIEENKIENVDEIVNQSRLKGTEVEITGLMVWRNITDPQYVILNAESDMVRKQKEMLDNLRYEGASYLKTPVSPHITMFKQSGYRQHVGMDVRQKIQSCVGDYSDLESTEISDIRAVVKT